MVDMKKKKKYYVSNEERIMMDWKSWADKYFPVESKLYNWKENERWVLTGKMSTIIDKKFIGILSPQLERFAWKRETLANCRCPICGDSEKNKSKCRGYFYQKENGFFYKCHNCGYGSNVYNFLKEVSPHCVRSIT